MGTIQNNLSQCSTNSRGLDLWPRLKLCIPNSRERFPLLCQGKELFVWMRPPIAARRCRKLQAECGKLSGAKTQIAAFSGGLDVPGEHDLSERMYHCLPRVWYQSLGVIASGTAQSL